MSKRFGPVRVLFLALLATLAGGCTTQQVAPASAGVPGLGPVLTVERFLQATSVKDLATMTALFGTHDGPIGGRREDTELRMNAIALALEHQDYEIGAETQVTGRTHPTRRIGVTLTRGTSRFADVPFLVVESGNGSWLIEEIGLDQMTGR